MEEKNRRRMEGRKKYLLLQLNDALFPIGGYSHSYGLETYIQKNVVKDKETAARYIRNNLLYSVCCNELLAVKMAYEGAEDGDLGRLLFLDKLVAASRTPAETRQAGEKMGSRFIKTVQALPVAFESRIFQEYASWKGKKNHAIAYGVFCFAAGIQKEQSLEHYLYGQTSAMVTNCVKTIPLSQITGQELLFGCQEIWPEVMEKVMEMSEKDYGASAPGFEISCMEHEGLYSRLYMS